MSSFIGHDQRAINIKYDTMSLYPMLMKYYYHLYQSIEFDNDFIDWRLDDDINLDIFQMTTWGTELAKRLVN